MNQHKRLRHTRARGFTLVEVLVALVILGLGVASILVAYSASLNLMRKARDESVAALLARSKLEETIATNNKDIVGDEDEERYNGVVYAYRITSSPLPLVGKGVAEHFKDLPALEEIKVEVFWGEAGHQQRYMLSSYRRITNTTSNTNTNNGQSGQSQPSSASPNPFH